MKIKGMKRIKRSVVLFLVNHIFNGTKQKSFKIKRKLLNSIGFDIGKGTKIVGPLEITGSFKCGKNCWIGKNFKINGNGTVIIGDNCDIGPEVTFQTGGHEIGSAERRAGEGKSFCQTVGNGTWIGGRATVAGDTNIGKASVIACCACVVNDIEDNALAGGVPAKMIRKLS